MTLHRALVCALIALALGAGSVAAANDRSGDGERGGRRGPPPEALQACAGGAQGQSCSFTGRRGETVSGTCEIPRGDKLVCFPEGGPPSQGRRGGGQDRPESG